MFNVCVSLVLDGKYVQFRVIRSLSCSIIVDTSKVDPHSIRYEEHSVKPTNISNYNETTRIAWHRSFIDCFVLFPSFFN